MPCLLCLFFNEMLALLWWHSSVVPCGLVLSALGRSNDDLLGSCENVAQFGGLLYTYTVLYKSKF
jgi:hypothetical protein